MNEKAMKLTLEERMSKYTSYKKLKEYINNLIEK
jgi:hypothetical protein